MTKRLVTITLEEGVVKDIIPHQNWQELIMEGDLVSFNSPSRERAEVGDTITWYRYQKEGQLGKKDLVIRLNDKNLVSAADVEYFLLYGV